MNRVLVATAPLLALAFAAVPSSGDTHDLEVIVYDFGYDPGLGVPPPLDTQAVVDIAAGDTVRFTNVGMFDHTVHSRARVTGAGPEVGLFLGVGVGLGTSVDITFAEPGTYEIHCETNEMHIALMHLTLRVN